MKRILFLALIMMGLMSCQNEEPMGPTKVIVTILDKDDILVKDAWVNMYDEDTYKLFEENSKKDIGTKPTGVMKTDEKGQAIFIYDNTIFAKQNQRFFTYGVVLSPKNYWLRGETLNRGETKYIKIKLKPYDSHE